MMTTAINTMASMGMTTVMAANMGMTTATNTTASQKINTVAKACSKVD